MEYVKEKWKQLTAFSKKEELKEQLWDEIVYLYAAQHRHYHNLNHIAHLFTLCDEYMGKIKKPVVMGFAIIYHDVIYDTYRTDNEEQSAELAATHLRQLSVNPSIVKEVREFIIATKTHEVPAGSTSAPDLALFLDFDMAILGTDSEMYQLYSETIRQEYSKYHDDFYKEGRKQALQSILASPSIFVTHDFRETLESKARENIEKEISLL